MKDLRPEDHAEEVALFRSEIIGALARRDLSHGELSAALRELAVKRWRPPDADSTRRYGVSTLERWLYAFRRGGLKALRPDARSDRGRARELSAVERALLLDIRREHPSASASLILRTLVTDGRMESGRVTPTTLRRLYRQEGLDRLTLRAGGAGHIRLRWQAERPDALWHGDVCHAPSLASNGAAQPVRIHALLDDCSRYVVALEVHSTEREDDMLALLVRTVRRHGIPDALYLDNGSTYRGDILRTACGRLGLTLLHAKPYQPEARGKMERFWRTLREQCLDHLGSLASLHDVQVRIWAWLDQHYHRAPHAGLMGKCPETVYRPGRPADSFDEKLLRDALTVRVRRRVRGDSTVSIDGHDWELDQGFLARQLVMVGRCLVDPNEPPWVEHDGKRLVMRLVDPVANARRRRTSKTIAEPKLPGRVQFDPPGALLDKAVGRRRRTEESR